MGENVKDTYLEEVTLYDKYLILLRSQMIDIIKEVLTDRQVTGPAVLWGSTPRFHSFSNDVTQQEFPFICSVDQWGVFVE